MPVNLRRDVDFRTRIVLGGAQTHLRHLGENLRVGFALHFLKTKGKVGDAKVSSDNKDGVCKRVKHVLGEKEG